MTEPSKDPPANGISTPDSSTPWNVTRSASINIGFFIAWLMLLRGTGEIPTGTEERTFRWTMAAWVGCSVLLVGSYFILAFQVLSLAVGHGIRVRGWIQAWTFLAGVLILGFAIGLVRFLFP
ncbi:MAG TPA: hypothetical protein VKW04_08940 [Planctomycetota bacterium]|nr:hypothetical protein [Planctomycetota bacterium]